MFSFIKHLWKHGGAESTESQWQEDFGTIYQFTLNDLDGNPFQFEDLTGKAVLITNVACDCGFTKDGYRNMVQIKTRHEDQPFEIVGFPSNQYNQETRSPEEIKSYLNEKFQLNFPLVEKSYINGEQTNAVYEWLKKSFPGDVTWNFSSYFLIDHRGIPIARFEKASWDDIKKAVQEAVDIAAEEEKKERKKQRKLAKKAKLAAAAAAPTTTEAEDKPAEETQQDEVPKNATDQDEGEKKSEDASL